MLLVHLRIAKHLWQDIYGGSNEKFGVEIPEKAENLLNVVGRPRDPTE
jgi:hypothetical protein